VIVRQDWAAPAQVQLWTADGLRYPQANLELSSALAQPLVAQPNEGPAPSTDDSRRPKRHARTCDLLVYHHRPCSCGL
jgi:hypothetical protein